MKAVLFKSLNRFESFKKKLEEKRVETIILDFNNNNWFDFDFKTVDIAIYFSNFIFTSNHPLALHHVYSDIDFLYRSFPHLAIFPDPHIIHYYNDKYRQYLFLSHHKFPIPDTIALTSEENIKDAINKFGFPLIVKNRYGAGGDFVFKVENRKQLTEVYRFSTQDYFRFSSLKRCVQQMMRREFWYHLIKVHRSEYMLLSFPLLAQRFIPIQCDLKTVIGDYQVVEGHWRRPQNNSSWKMNIDGGGVGEWSHIPEEALHLSESLARKLETRWLNIDLFQSDKKFIISEFSPVWHHYRYKEKPSFVYKDDYNIVLPLQKALDLEEIVVSSLMNASKQK